MASVKAIAFALAVLAMAPQTSGVFLAVKKVGNFHHPLHHHHPAISAPLAPVPMMPVPMAPMPVAPVAFAHPVAPIPVVRHMPAATGGVSKFGFGVIG
ncbi:hypothetical protein QYM36_012292 [Artemia franciscana]|uniref:Uncharacterized protein n=1 Tax=Artemia franciscana TaxID=6661 RepID=A0AA88HPV6_ARTSF|nr:hypothetical protein QYM36_012292 [Artemia franciscana]